jgi:hypothetical protein
LEQGEWNIRTPISQSAKFIDGIKILPPDLELSEFFSGFVNLDGLTSSYQVKISYRNPLNGKQYVENQILEWKSLQGKLGAGNEWYELSERFGKEISEIIPLLKAVVKNK